MRKLVFTFLISFVSMGLYAQDSVVQEIMTRGIELHDQGHYDAAITEYEQALALKPKDAFVNYELALSHYYKEDYDKTIAYASVAAAEESESGLQAVILLGSVYDQTGDYKRSLKTLEKGIKTFGDYFLIWYNIGVTATGHEDFEKAEEAFVKAVNNKLDHTNSHFALGRILLAQDRRVEAVYPLLFCALLDPNSERSAIVYQSVEQAFGAGVVRENDTTTGITMTVGQKGEGQAIRSAELMMSMLEASRYLEKYDTLTEEEIDVEVMSSFLRFMAELDLGKRDDFFTNYYIPFFGAVAESEHMTSFYHFIRMSMYPSSQQWYDEHAQAMQDLFDWLDGLDI
ncbi:MAG: tetratricopeptide repeat protein [Flavobacteriales bacterium]|nr:tetratricopeptide repeat protein [Flavobacteriales bacterium]